MIGNIVVALSDPLMTGAAVLLITGAAVLIKHFTGKKEEKIIMVMGPNGRMINYQELLYQKKYIDFRKHSWDCINVVEFPGIQSYRQKVPTGVSKKGVVHFVHGYGDPLPHYAYLAKRFTEMGFEFCGIDQ